MTTIKPAERPLAAPSLDEDYALVKQAAREAGDLALTYFRRQIEVKRKPDGSEVSEADFAVDTALDGERALGLAADRLPGIGLQLDLKRLGIEAVTVETVRRHGVLDRSWISTFDARSLRRLAELEPELPRSYTLPRDRFGIAKRGPLAPVVRAALGSIGASLPRRLPALLARARAGAATLHYSIASRAAIDSAHEVDAAVYVWTVDDPRLAESLVRDGADGIITNDPRIFTMFTA